MTRNILSFNRLAFSTTLFLCLAIFATTTSAQHEKSDASKTEATNEGENENFAKFEKLMTGAKLVGSFTVTGNESKELQEEEYTIEKVSKMDEGDLWMIKARIKYGKYDFTVPMPLDVKWAEDTPVITLTDFEIPGFGTFSSRVLFYNGKYAGTWSHGDHGGHLFGRIVTKEMQEKEAAQSESGGEKSEDSESEKDGSGKRNDDKSK